MGEVDKMYKTSTSKNKTPPEAGLFASLTDSGIDELTDNEPPIGDFTVKGDRLSIPHDSRQR